MIISSIKRWQSPARSTRRILRITSNSGLEVSRISIPIDREITTDDRRSRTRRPSIVISFTVVSPPSPPLSLLSVHDNRLGKRLRHDDVISRGYAPYGATPLRRIIGRDRRDRGLDWGGQVGPGNVVDRESIARTALEV